MGYDPIELVMGLTKAPRVSHTTGRAGVCFPLGAITLDNTRLPADLNGVYALAPYALSTGPGR